MLCDQISLPGIAWIGETWSDSGTEHWSISNGRRSLNPQVLPVAGPTPRRSNVDRRRGTTASVVQCCTSPEARRRGAVPPWPRRVHNAHCRGLHRGSAHIGPRGRRGAPRARGTVSIRRLLFRRGAGRGRAAHGLHAGLARPAPSPARPAPPGAVRPHTTSRTALTAAGRSSPAPAP